MRKIMLIFIALVVCVNVGVAYAASDEEYVTGRVKWGMDGVAVHEAEGRPLKTIKLRDEDKGEVLVYEKTILDAKCYIFYHFKEYQLDLNEITYFFKPKNNINAKTIYMQLDAALSKKYNKSIVPEKGSALERLSKMITKNW